MNKNFFLSYIDAFLFALMVGGGETYFTAYSLSLGHTAIQAGVLASAPMAVGGLIQLLTPLLFNKIKNFKFSILITAVIQSLIFLSLFYLNHISYPILFVLVSFYWSGFFASSSIWNSWMSMLIRPKDQVSFFSNRSFFTYFGVLLGIVGSGLLIQWDPNSFKLIIILCFIFRLFSAIAISLHQEEGVEFSPMRSFSIKLLREVSNYPEITKIGIFVLIFKFGVFFSAPFYSPYMLEVLNFSYLKFMLVIAVSFLGRIIAMRVVRKYVNDLRAQKTFFIASFGITITPLLWMYFKDFNSLLFLEVLTGAMWGVFEVLFIIAIFQKLTSQENLYFMISFNFLHSIAVGAGTIAGALSFKYISMDLNPYLFIFGVSAILRGLGLLYFPDFKLKKVKIRLLPFLRPLGVRPNIGLMERPSWRLIRKNKYLDRS